MHGYNWRFGVPFRRLALQGYWPVLLIAVVQLVLVAWILVGAWQRAWVQLRFGSQVVELGTFLMSEEKRQLAQYVKSAIVEHWAMKGAFNFWGSKFR